MAALELNHFSATVHEVVKQLAWGPAFLIPAAWAGTERSASRSAIVKIADPGPNARHWRLRLLAGLFGNAVEVGDGGSQRKLFNLLPAPLCRELIGGKIAYPGGLSICSERNVDVCLACCIDAHGADSASQNP